MAAFAFTGCESAEADKITLCNNSTLKIERQGTETRIYDLRGNEIKEQIEEYKELLKSGKKWETYYKESYDFWKMSADTELAKSNYKSYKWYKEDCKNTRNAIRQLKSLLVA